jgi:hypothetical protein
MTKRGKTRTQPPAPAFVDVPLPGLQSPPAASQPEPYDVLQRLRSGALGDVVSEDLERSRAVMRLRRERHELERATARMAEAVAAARGLGVSWDAIGAATGNQGETMRRRHGSR